LNFSQHVFGAIAGELAFFNIKGRLSIPGKAFEKNPKRIWNFKILKKNRNGYFPLSSI